MLLESSHFYLCHKNVFVSGISQESSHIFISLHIIKYYSSYLLYRDYTYMFLHFHYMKGNVKYINLNEIFHRLL